MADNGVSKVGDVNETATISEPTIADSGRGVCPDCDFSADNFKQVPETQVYQVRCRAVSKTVDVQTDLGSPKDCPNYPLQGRVSLNKNNPPKYGERQSKRGIVCFEEEVPSPQFKG